MFIQERLKKIILISIGPQLSFNFVCRFATQLSAASRTWKCICARTQASVRSNAICA